MESKNKLKGNRSKAPVICISAIIAVLGILFILYATYTYLGYMDSNNIDEPGITDTISSFSLLFTEESFFLPINAETLQRVFLMQIDLWWVYVVIAVFIFFIVTSKSNDDFRSVEHGSAKWAEKYDRKQFTDNTGIPCGENFYATVTNPKGKFYNPHNLNEIVIGGSGAGKSYRKIKPDIIQMTGSYVVTDPSGELYRDCAGFLRKNGYKVRVLNLTNIRQSNSYNPFKYMVEEQDVLNIADLFMKNSAGEGEKDDFWSNAAQDMLVMIMLYLFKSESEIKSFGRVIRLVNSIKYDNEGKIDATCELASCMERHMCKDENEDDAVSTNWKSLLGTPQETLGSIAKTLSTRLRLWAVEDVDMLTGDDEMDFDDIGVNKTAIFLIIPAARQTYKAVANIFYSQLFERLMYIAGLKYNNRLPLLVSCELDEFANIGRIPNFSETLAVVRKYNIRLCIVLQGISQLKAIYEKTFDSIVGNCSIFTFLGTNDWDSKEYVSKRLGKTTVRTSTKSYNRGNQGGGSDSESYSARELLMPEEISRALKKGRRGKCIVFVDEFNPFFLDKFDTAKHPRISEVGSDRGQYQTNNADIGADFADKMSERKKKYEELQKKNHQVSDELENLEKSFKESKESMQSFNDNIIKPDTDIYESAEEIEF